MQNEVISWDEYFMGIAILSSKRSKDPVTQVGACIVDKDNKILSMGYNGFPSGIDDNKFPWGKVGDFSDTKHAYVCHAELNAILNANVSLKGARVYVTLFPCNECTKAIIQSKISEVFFVSDKYKDTQATIASKRMLDAVGIKYTKLNIDKPIILSCADDR